MDYLVRRSCEYWILVEADSAEDALVQAEMASDHEWGQSWSEMEVDQ